MQDVGHRIAHSYPGVRGKIPGVSDCRMTRRRVLSYPVGIGYGQPQTPRLRIPFRPVATGRLALSAAGLNLWVSLAAIVQHEAHQRAKPLK